MAERLGLGLCGGRGDKGSLGFGGRGGVGEEVDLLRDGAAKIGDGLADVGWVVVGFVGVLRAGRSGALAGLLEGRGGGVIRDLEHARVHLLQRIDALFELDVVGRELGLLYRVNARFKHPLLETWQALDRAQDMSRDRRTLSSTWPTCSFTYCCVLAAHGEKEALSTPVSIS